MVEKLPASIYKFRDAIVRYLGSGEVCIHPDTPPIDFNTPPWFVIKGVVNILHATATKHTKMFFFCREDD